MVFFFKFPTESPRREIYFLAMIDILTKYGVKKRTATAAKTVKHGAGAEFSTVRYDQYAKRFLEFINKCIEWWPWSLCSHFHSVYKLRRWRYFVPQILCYKWWSAKVTIKSITSCMGVWMTRHVALFYVKGLIVNFIFCTTCTCG